MEGEKVFLLGIKQVIMENPDLNVLELAKSFSLSCVNTMCESYVNTIL